MMHEKCSEGRVGEDWMEKIYDLIIVGSGPAGLAAGDICKAGRA